MKKKLSREDVDRAVSAIRRACPEPAAIVKIVGRNGQSNPITGRFPDDLGCKTQLYLAWAIQAIDPGVSPTQLASLCRADLIDAHFLGQLVEENRSREWVNEEIIASAVEALIASSVTHEPSRETVSCVD